jgi:hypothetical protein
MKLVEYHVSAENFSRIEVYSVMFRPSCSVRHYYLINLLISLFII